MTQHLPVLFATASVFIDALSWLEEFLWGTLGIGVILLLGLYFTIRSRFAQIRRFPGSISYFYRSIRTTTEGRGVPPVQAFFAAVGGAIGIGNIVTVVGAVHFGGPGAVFWIWLAGFFGMILKYSEVYLGVKHRVKNEEGGWTGGPQIFLAKAYKNLWIPKLVCVLLCVYGVEVFMFNTVVNSISREWELDSTIVNLGFLFLVFITALGGVKRVGQVSSVVIPFFVLIYIAMVSYVLYYEAHLIPVVFSSIFTHAFTGKSVLTGAAAGSVMLGAYKGIMAGCYSGDIGIGYASVIHAETRETVPERQASLAIFGIFLDTFIVCTASVLLVLVTGVWNDTSLQPSQFVATALSHYFPYTNVFMPIFLFLLGYSTIIAYMLVGLKAAAHLSPFKGRRVFSAYALIAFVCASQLAEGDALKVMVITGGLLMPINLVGIFLLRKEIKFD